MKKSLVFASVACAGAFALQAAYNDWFTAIGATAASTNSMDESNGAWVFNVTNGTAEVNASHKLEFDLDDGETVVFNADQAAAIDTNTITRVTVKGVFTPVKFSDLPTDAEMNSRGAQVGFVVSSETVSETTTYKYYGWVGGLAGSASGTWIPMGSAIAEADLAAESEIRIDFDYRRSLLTAPANVNYVTFNTVSGGTATPLTGGVDLEITSTAGAAAHSVAGMTCYGSGTLASADGAVEIGVAKVEGVKYGSMSNAVAAASSATDKTIEVVRTPANTADGTAELPNGVSIYDPEQKASGAHISVADGATVTIKPTVAEVNGGASGSCTVPLDITLGTGSQVQIDLSVTAPGKEVVGAVDVSGNTATFTTQTAKSVLTAATVGGKNLDLSDATKETALRTLLNTYAIDAYTNAYLSTDAAKTAIAAGLNTIPTSQNGLTLWQDYALGIQPTASVKPVAAPVDSNDDAVSLSIPALTTATPSGDFKIKYQIDSEEAAALTSGAISVPLPSSAGGQRHSVKIVFDPN